MNQQTLTHSPAMPDATAQERLAAARAGDQDAFARLVEPYRHALELHCYRMLGSLEDAEDVLQTTLLRAWQNLAAFENRSSLKTWLYTIATHACLDALDKRRRRNLPPAIRPPSEPGQPIEPPPAEALWLEPYPDDLLPDTIIGPEARYDQKESISFAFLTALQVLAPRQRAVLILSDVLDLRAAEVAGLLDLSVSAVNSALHRARASLSRHYRPETIQPTSEATRSLLSRYVQAWERADIAGLTELLKEDATFSMPPSPTWFQGSAAIQTVLESVVFSNNAPRSWKLRPTQINGQPGFVVYQRSAPDAAYHFFGIQAIRFEPSPDRARIAAVITFLDPALAVRFGSPLELA
jgi:RNA polymerase sigma-70 factor (ECF subfamily)